MSGSAAYTCLAPAREANKNPDSDIDLLIVLDQIDAYGAEIDRTSELISSVSLQCGISISRVFVTQKAWRDAQSGFLSRVRREAIAA